MRRQRKLPKRKKIKKEGEEFRIFIKTEFILEENHRQEPDQFQKLLYIF